MAPPTSRSDQRQQRLQRGGIVFLPSEVDVQRTDPQRQILHAAGFGGEQAGMLAPFRAGRGNAASRIRCSLSCGLGRDRVVGVGDLVLAINVHQLRLEAVGFLLGHAGERGDDDDVTDLHVARGATVGETTPLPASARMA